MAQRNSQIRGTHVILGLGIVLAFVLVLFSLPERPVPGSAPTWHKDAIFPPGVPQPAGPYPVTEEAPGPAEGAEEEIDPNPIG